MEISTKRVSLSSKKRFSDKGSLYKKKIVTVVTIKGKVTAASCEELEDRIDELLYYGLTSIVMNLSKVSMIDSMGVSTLINILKKVKTFNDNADIKVTNISRGVKTRLSFTALKNEDVNIIAPQSNRAQKVLKMVHLQDIINIYTNEDDAIGSFKKEE